MNTTLTGQLTPTQTNVLSLITTDREDTLWPFEIVEPPEPEDDYPEFPEPDDLLDISDFFQADVTCMKMLYLEDRMSEIESLYRRELQHLDSWKQRRTGILQRQYDFFSRSLESWLMASNQKTANLPHGILQFRRQPVRVEVLDEETIIRLGEFIRTKLTVDKAAIKKHYVQTGEIPDGVEIVEQEPKFSIKLTPGKEHAHVQSQNPPAAG
ncbi:host-nuclease inhibitor Gam family protein [bacterium]|nr:host-nuclease inhibitor Gam family protein [bacterium]